VLIPFISARIIQSRYLACVRVNAGEIGSFMKVTSVTCEGQIIFPRLASMLARNDMLDMKNSIYCLLRHKAVFAAIASSFTDSPPQPASH